MMIALQPSMATIGCSSCQEPWAFVPWQMCRMAATKALSGANSA
jgi:hypothetical protein